MTDYAEYVAGTVPTNWRSRLEFVRIALTNATDRVLTFDSVMNRYYLIEYRSSLTDGAWTNLPPEVPGTGWPLRIMDTDGDDRRYYRIGVRLP